MPNCLGFRPRDQVLVGMMRVKNLTAVLLMWGAKPGTRPLSHSLS